MKWLEIIHLRAAEQGLQSLYDMLAERCVALQQMSGVLSTEIYKAVECDGDLAMILHWDLEGQGAEKSQAGLLLADFLEKYGMVNHKILKQVFPVQD